MQMLGGETAQLRNALIAAIGPVTAEAVRDMGLDPAVVAERYTIEGLVAALVAHVRDAASAAV